MGQSSGNQEVLHPFKKVVGEIGVLIDNWWNKVFRSQLLEKDSERVVGKTGFFNHRC